MNDNLTLKDEILQISREIIQRKGCLAFNIRTVANACGISVGSIYNYFDSKTALLEVTIESVWREIFEHSEVGGPVFLDIQSCITWFYERIEYGCRYYPGFFTFHSLSFVREEGLEGKWKKQQTWQHILEELRTVLKRDINIRSNAFSEEFTLENFAEILFSLILSALLCKNYDSSAIREIINRTLY